MQLVRHNGKKKLFTNSQGHYILVSSYLMLISLSLMPTDVVLCTSVVVSQSSYLLACFLMHRSGLFTRNSLPAASTDTDNPTEDGR